MQKKVYNIQEEELKGAKNHCETIRFGSVLQHVIRSKKLL